MIFIDLVVIVEFFNNVGIFFYVIFVIYWFIWILLWLVKIVFMVFFYFLGRYVFF